MSVFLSLKSVSLSLSHFLLFLSVLFSRQTLRMKRLEFRQYVKFTLWLRYGIPRSVFLQLSDPRPLFQSLHVRYTTFSLTAFLSLNRTALFICCLLPLSVCVFQNPLRSAFSKSGFMCAAKTDSTFTLRSHLDRSVWVLRKQAARWLASLLNKVWLCAVNTLIAAM